MRQARLPGTVERLSAQLDTGEVDVRWRSAYLLARLDDPNARAALHDHLAPLSVPDLQAEALIAHAGRPESPDPFFRARDVVRRHLGPAVKSDQPIDMVLGRRDEHRTRALGARGERRRLFAAGYLLARSADPVQRGWLQQRLDRLSDRGAARFFADRLANPWTTFDEPW